jgi:type IV pilus assembly protein PilQ
MTLDKPVPWDQVLDLVLRMNQLGMTYEGDIVRIATLETLRQEDDLRKAKLESIRKSREEAKALEPLVTKYIAVSYANADSEIKPHLEKILTKDRGSLSIDQKNNQIIVTDTAAKVAQASDIVRRIDKVTSQVIIEAKVVEVSKDFSRSLGIDWNLSYGPGVLPGTSLNTSTDMAMNFPSASSSSIGVSFSRLSGVPFVLDARLNALETTGDGRLLSSPKILTLDNKKATIKQGLEYPYFERDSSGGSSVKFKSIDLLLEVTPHVTPDNRISMAILLTKNDVDSLVGGVPALSTNEAETELLVNDGDTVVIGGIVKQTENQSDSGFPLLSKIPGLGWAFKTDSRSNSKNELLIFITPRIVQLEQEIVQ